MNSDATSPTPAGAEPIANLPWWRHDRPWGFRFSAFDAAVILLGAAVTSFGLLYQPELAVLTPFVLGHFLLFCNTFRVGGERSLLWIALLFANTLAWAYFGNFSWSGVLLIQCVFTLLLIANCLVGKNYHGIACDRINPGGFRAGATTEGTFTRAVLKRLRLSDRAVDILMTRKTQGEIQ